MSWYGFSVAVNKDTHQVVDLLSRLGFTKEYWNETYPYIDLDDDGDKGLCFSTSQVPYNTLLLPNQVEQVALLMLLGLEMDTIKEILEES